MRFTLLCMLKGMFRALRVIFSLVVLLLISGISTWFLWGKPWLMPASLAVRQLEDVVRELEQSQVTAYRNQNWCKNIAYNYGKFSESSHPTTCNLFEGTPQPFDEQATKEFQKFRRTLRLTGVRVAFVNTYFEAGKLHSAEFHLNCLLCSRTHYVYEPKYVLPANEGSEIWYKAINQTWYVVNEDWTQ
jgi:hypothetical protein